MIEIAFAIDDKFATYCAVSMLSALRTRGEEMIRFHVLAPSLTEENRLLLRETARAYGAAVELHIVPDERVSGYDVRWEKKRLPRVVFYRCILASVLPAEVERVLYLDSDVLVLQPLDDLWNLDLERLALAAVQDGVTGNQWHCKRLGYAAEHNYFNGGVLLLNLKYWRENGVEEQCQTYYQQHLDRIVYNDQDLLNGLLHARKTLVPLKWNVQESAYRLPRGCASDWQPAYFETLRHPAILHYSARKPWHYHCMHPLRRLFFDCAAHLPAPYRVKPFTPWQRLHRILHFIPYYIGVKRRKYINNSSFGFTCT